MKKGRLKFLLKFNDGTSDYAAESEAKLDCPELLLKYKKEKLGKKKNKNIRKKAVLAVKANKY